MQDVDELKRAAATMLVKAMQRGGDYGLTNQATAKLTGCETTEQAKNKMLIDRNGTSVFDKTVC